MTADTPPHAASEPLTEPEQIADLLGSIRRHRIFAIDTEFIAERSYRPRLALVQLATPDRIALIDPLPAAQPDQPIWQAAADPQITTVVHAHEQESRFCLERTGRPPANLFDVQLAAGFCGHRFPIAYSALVRSELDAPAAASQSRTDWTRRPLSRSQLRYAVDDVRWLLPLHQTLSARLAADRRGRWLREETQARTAALEPDAAATAAPRWRKLSGARRLSRRGLAALRELHAWRDQAAQASDAPAKRIARDDALVAVAATLPRSQDDLLRVRGCEDLARRHRTAVLAAVERALQLPDAELPQRANQKPSAPRTLTSFVDALLDALCAEQQIDSKLLAANADLQELIEWARRGAAAQRSERPRLLCGWRRELAGDTILAALNGRVALRVADPAAEQPLVAERS